MLLGKKSLKPGLLNKNKDIFEMNRGDFMKKVEKSLFAKRVDFSLISQIKNADYCEKALVNQRKICFTLRENLSICKKKSKKSLFAVLKIS